MLKQPDITPGRYTGWAHYYPQVANISAAHCAHAIARSRPLHAPQRPFRPAQASMRLHIELDGRKVEESLPKFKWITPSTCPQATKAPRSAHATQGGGGASLPGVKDRCGGPESRLEPTWQQDSRLHQAPIDQDATPLRSAQHAPHSPRRGAPHATPARDQTGCHKERRTSV